MTLIKEAITKCNASNIYHKGSDNADRQQWNYFSKHVRQRWNNPKFFFLPPFLSWCVCWISQIGANYDLDRGWRNAQTASCAFCLSSHPIWKHPGNSLAALTTPASIFQINANNFFSYYLLHLVHTAIKSCWKLACGVHTVSTMWLHCGQKTFL